MKTIKGPAIFLAQFAGDAAPFNSFDSICGWAASLGYKGVQIPSWDTRLFDLDEGLGLQGLLRRDRRHGEAARAGGDRAFDAPAGPARRRPSRPMTRCLRRVRAAEGARQSQGAAGMGGRPGEAGTARASRHMGLAAHADLFRRARLALPLPVAAAAGRPDRGGVRRAGAALEADPRLLRRAGRRRLLRDPSGRGPARRRDLRDVPGARRRAPAREPALRSRRTSCCSSSTTSTYIDIYHERIRAFHVKDAEFNPTGRQGVYGGYQSWVDRAGRFRSPRRRAGRFRRASSRSSPRTTSTAGLCSNGNAR